jgi:hypothetical protein
VNYNGILAKDKQCSKNGIHLQIHRWGKTDSVLNFAHTMGHLFILLHVFLYHQQHIFLFMTIGCQKQIAKGLINLLGEFEDV